MPATPALLRKRRNAAIRVISGPFFRAGVTPDEAAPIASPHTEPGIPGSIIVVDSASKRAVVAGEYASAGNALIGDPRAYDPVSRARVAGLATVWRHRADAAAQALAGFNNATLNTNRLTQGVLHFNNTYAFPTMAGASGGIAIVVANNATYEFMVVLRAAGALYYIRGGGFAAWTLFHVDNVVTTSPLYGMIANPSNVAASVSEGIDSSFRTAYLGGSHASEYGVATQRLAGARAALDTFTHTPDCLIEFVITTLPSAGSIDIHFRKTDASNYWLIRISTTGALTLFEVVATVETQRATAAAVISNGHRALVRAWGGTIAAASNDTSRWSYTSAITSIGATAGSVASLGTGGAVADLVAWPAYPTLPSGLGSGPPTFPLAVATNLIRFERYRTTPVLTKGAAAFNTGGSVNVTNWALDALAAPSVCRDVAGTGWVLAVSGWNQADGKWRSGFFTSPDLETWTFVANSVQSPGGGNYILGNGGIICIGSTYHHYYNEYPSGATSGVTIHHATSTDLATWTIVSTDCVPAGGTGAPDSTGQYDPTIALNPTTGLYELWYIGNPGLTGSGGRSALRATSPDSVTFTRADGSGATGGSAQNVATWNVSLYGEPHPFYQGGDTYVTADGGSPRWIDASRKVGAAWAYSPRALASTWANSWESMMVFDPCCVGALDRGDGRGTRLWMVYAGSAVSAGTDNTQSSIGLVSAPLPPPATLPFLLDTFQGGVMDLALHTADSGHAWATHPYRATPIVLEGTARVLNSVASGIAVAMSLAAPPSADYEVTAQWFNTGIGGVMGRLDPTTEDGYLLWCSSAGTAWRLYKVVAGALTQLGSTYAATIGGRHATGTLRMQGTSIKAIIDGVERISVTDATFVSAGRVGLYLVDNGLRLANLEATAL